jgi:hypothetical protein
MEMKTCKLSIRKSAETTKVRNDLGREEGGGAGSR